MFKLVQLNEYHNIRGLILLDILRMPSRNCKVTSKSARLFFNIFCIVVGGTIFFGIWTQFHYKSPIGHKKKDNMKYILKWTLPETIPFAYILDSQETFKKRKCEMQNCYATPNKHYFDDISMFDAILFHGPEIVSKRKLDAPSKRSANQKYIFVSLESSHYYPLLSDIYNGFFNWTWTFRLNSDVRFAYITVRDKENNIIGPNEIMHWKSVEQMQPLDEDFKRRLQFKRKAAAWFVSNCFSKSKREEFVVELNKELQQYYLNVDIYGGCGTMKCPTENMNDCLKRIEMEYYFYLSFENSFSEDYVTEKLLHGLQHYAIPVVYGSANYTRFMPNGIYLDARKLGARQLAKQMKEIIDDKEIYYSFFKWHNHYSYHNPDEAPDSDSYCQLCAMLNDNDTESLSQRTVYDDFKDWWMRG